MTRTEEMIKVMQAFVDGREIEWTTRNNDIWTSSQDTWNWVDFDYRIKKEEVVLTLSEIERELGYKIKVVS